LNSAVTVPMVAELPPARLTPISRVWMVVLRGYLVIAAMQLFWSTDDDCPRPGAAVVLCAEYRRLETALYHAAHGETADRDKPLM